MQKISSAFLIIMFGSFTGLATHEPTRHHLKIFNFHEPFPSDCDDSPEPCYGIEDLTKMALESRISSREKIQLLFQAQKEIRQKMGQILPQLNPTSIAGSLLKIKMEYLIPYFNIASLAQEILSIDMILPFVGFLFPSRWYDWKSSRYLKKAELDSLAAFNANTAQTVQRLYFDIQMQLWSIHILEFYIKEVEELIKFLIEQRDAGIRRVTDEDIGILENIKGKLVYDRAFIDGLSAALPQLATAVGLAPDFDWSHLKIEPYNFEPITQKKSRKYQEFWPEALAQSPEVRNAENLIVAAKANKRSIYFDFFDPASGHDLGFGYGSRIKIARSQVEILNISLKRTKMELSNLIQDSLNNYNDAVESFPGLDNGLKHLENIKLDLNEHINNADEPLDITRIALHFKYAEGQAIRYTYSYFLFRAAEASLNRYTWQGSIYQIVNDFMTFKVPQLLKETKKQHSFRQAFKNKVGNFRCFTNADD